MGVFLRARYPCRHTSHYSRPQGYLAHNTPPPSVGPYLAWPSHQRSRYPCIEDASAKGCGRSSEIARARIALTPRARLLALGALCWRPWSSLSLRPCNRGGGEDQGLRQLLSSEYAHVRQSSAVGRVWHIKDQILALALIQVLGDRQGANCVAPSGLAALAFLELFVDAGLQQRVRA